MTHNMAKILSITSLLTTLTCLPLRAEDVVIVSDPNLTDQEIAELYLNRVQPIEAVQGQSTRNDDPVKVVVLEYETHQESGLTPNHESMTANVPIPVSAVPANTAIWGLGALALISAIVYETCKQSGKGLVLAAIRQFSAAPSTPPTQPTTTQASIPTQESEMAELKAQLTQLLAHFEKSGETKP